MEGLNAPVFAFIRLQKAVLFGDITEVPVPTRFMFILLGTPGNQSKYREIGRSIATLMSDEVFRLYVNYNDDDKMKVTNYMKVT